MIFWLVKTDEYENMLWNQTYGGADSDIVRSLVEVSGGGFALAGYTNSLGAEFYVYIAKNGPQTAIDLNRALNYSKTQISRGLTNLTGKALVAQDGTTFSALPFEEALELLIEREKEHAQVMNEAKEEQM